jgi:hypothetical protein
MSCYISLYLIAPATLGLCLCVEIRTEEQNENSGGKSKPSRKPEKRSISFLSFNKPHTAGVGFRSMILSKLTSSDATLKQLYCRSKALGRKLNKITNRRRCQNDNNTHWIRLYSLAKKFRIIENHIEFFFCRKGALETIEMNSNSPTCIRTTTMR